MPRFTSLLLLGGLLSTPLATGLAQGRERPAPRRESPAPERAPRVEPPQAEPRREAPAERREAPPPRSTGEPELRRRKAEKPD